MTVDDPTQAGVKASDGPDKATPADPSKRRFIAGATHAIGACVTCALAVPPVAMLTHPLWASESESGSRDGFVAVGAVDRFTPDAPFVRVIVKRDTSDAWLKRRGVPVGSILVRRDAKGAFTVFSAKCPHLGCAVNPAADGDGFFCPCHNSSFAADGAKRDRADGATNPAPRGLDTLEHRVTNGTLHVKYVNFKTGTSEQVVVG